MFQKAYFLQNDVGLRDGATMAPDMPGCTRAPTSGFYNTVQNCRGKFAEVYYLKRSGLLKTH